VPLRSPLESETERFFRLSRTIAIRCVVLVSGGGLLAAGAILLLVPALGVKTILLGLAVLASQFVWARRLLLRAEERLRGEGRGRAGGDGRRS